jgi:CheY-like chemotaxis protein
MRRLKKILLVEDSEEDRMLFSLASKRMSLNEPVEVLEDGEQAIEHLSGKGKYADRLEHPLPDMIFLDIKMPKRNGFEVLEWLRKESKLPHIPVVMCTASDYELDVEKAYKLGANAYLVKPTNINTLTENLRASTEFWLRHNHPDAGHLG